MPNMQENTCKKSYYHEDYKLKQGDDEKENDKSIPMHKYHYIIIIKFKKKKENEG